MPARTALTTHVAATATESATTLTKARDREAVELLDLDAIVVATAQGLTAAQGLREVLLTLALKQVIDADLAARIADCAVYGLRCKRYGRPVPGRAVAWIEEIVRVLGKAQREHQGRERWEEWDPPGRIEEEGGEGED